MEEGLSFMNWGFAPSKTHRDGFCIGLQVIGILIWGPEMCIIIPDSVVH